MVCGSMVTFQVSDPDPVFLAFVFSSTLCSYNLHWFLTHEAAASSIRLNWANQYRHFHFWFFLTGLVGSIFFGSFFWKKAIWILPAVIFTFLYTAPKIPFSAFRTLQKIAIGKTIYLALVWTYVTSILPLKIGNLVWTQEMTHHALSRFFFIYAICILFDFRDREDDKRDGIRSLITHFDEQGIKRLLVFSLLLSLIFSFMANAELNSSPYLFSQILPTLGLFGLMERSMKNFSDYFYYFLLDGWMVLPALLFLAFH